VTVSDDLVESLFARAAAGRVATPRAVELAASLDGLGHALARLLPADSLDADGYRRQGRIHLDGVGYVIESFPYGGSVIDGYTYQLTAVLADGAILTAEQHDLEPSCLAHVHVETPALSTTLDHADQDARVRIESDYSVWLHLQFAVLDRVRERFGWPVPANLKETLAITVDGSTVRFTYTRDRAFSGTATLDVKRVLGPAVWS
jgi:hypothetical protein